MLLIQQRYRLLRKPVQNILLEAGKRFPGEMENFTFANR